MIGGIEFILKIFREIYTRIAGFPPTRAVDEIRVQYFNEAANEYIYTKVAEALKDGKGLALCKLGTVELGCIVSWLNRNKWRMKDYEHFIQGYPVPLFYQKEIQRLNNNAGVFPATETIANRFCQLMLQDMQETDILASYAWCERYVQNYISHSDTINLDGYYAPFRYEHPWTRILKDKRVLVVHPFAESILAQYKKRAFLFDNPEVLPEFKSLRVVKAVQSIAGNACGFNDWFDALGSMTSEMDKEDFDVALIGCGAYGVPLTIHTKRLGKVGIHLAGWTQMLFGIYGKRWLSDQPQYKRFINNYWIRPGQTEVPKGAEKVEGGCYW